QEFRGDGDHFGNFVQAVRSRNVGDLAADIEQGHLSSALCHLGNISMRLGESVSIASVKERLDSMPNKAEVFETFDRFNEHVKENGLDPEKTNISYGKVLTIDPKEEIFVGEHASMANPMLTREYRAPFVVPASV
ncbi:MAG: gfo/Idh/MocA family oxidoreductase, partial [Planctomycetaceae bacterium]|nr:gfo/Idh/MocA family oxidoreductase [Planctomycetaceae bacterium]